MTTTAESLNLKPGYLPIGDYGLIGDGRTAALVSRTGSIDWLCLPRFDSPFVFAAILDTKIGGRFLIAPAEDFRSERRYLPGTNVIETTFHCADGTFTVRDMFTVASEAVKRSTPYPEMEILREVRGTAGEASVELWYQPRPHYARTWPELIDRGHHGIWCDVTGGAIVLMSDIPLSIIESGATAQGIFRIRAGERRYFSMAYASHGPAILPVLGDAAAERIERTIRWWTRWSARCTYEGPNRDIVIRSALVLKLMSFAPSGAIVAAPTTSLPETIGGIRNWDYRFCWIRDAAFTVRALYELGYDQEANAFLGWLLHATRLTWPDLHALYDVYGRTNLTEHELHHLEGYSGSSPVRIGNGAYTQFQLDVYGELIDAASQLVSRYHQLDSETQQLLRGLGETITNRWCEPDDGIWEPRTGRQHHTLSKALAWVGLDRLLAMHEDGSLKLSDEEVNRFRAHRAAIRATIEARGFNPQLGAYTRTLDGFDFDASTLLMTLYGYVDGSSPRARGTYERVRQHLGVDGLIYRYKPGTDGLPGIEGAFGVCSFWAVECQAKAGDVAGAINSFERLLTYANDLGLFGEEMDPQSRAVLGNFPQAFTHLGLINAAITIERASRQRLVSIQPSLRQ